MAQFTTKADREKRRGEILLAAYVELRSSGYRGTSMLTIARRAKASKETLYAWFGSKPGLFAELVRTNSGMVQQVLSAALDADKCPRIALTDFGEALLRLLLGEAAVCLNRAAISDVEKDDSLAVVINENGREATLPVLIEYLEHQRALNRVDFDDAATAAQFLIGVLLGDAQIRRLLNVLPEPEDTWITDRVDRAVSVFMQVYEVSPT